MNSVSLSSSLINARYLDTTTMNQIVIAADPTPLLVASFITGFIVGIDIGLFVGIDIGLFVGIDMRCGH